MDQALTFSRGKLADFIACQRRFQLRYQRKLAWPIRPLEQKSAAAIERGRRFHQLLQQHFLGLSVSAPPEDEPELAQWWRLFQAQGPQLPDGNHLPEFSLTAPIGQYFLTGRYDLLIAGESGLHIYDWKTGTRPPSLAALRDDLQTGVYLALAAEGARAVWPGLRPEGIRLSYWYVSDPPETRTLAYDAAWHEKNWSRLVELVDQIGRQLASSEKMPLTDDLDQCRRCAYQVYCGRQTGGMDLAEWPADQASPELEPDRP